MKVDQLLLNETVLLTGGTGSFGNAVLKKLLPLGVKEVRIFSRDEKKQDDMRKRYNDPRLKFMLGDVRDRESVIKACRGVNYIFHAAALKQVPSCEFYPIEALKTNVMGTDNVINSAIEAGVKRVVCLSTDKAVYPINAMGMSKALMEKVMVAASRNLIDSDTVVCGTRYGNVMASRGSVIPLFVEQVQLGKDLTITDPDMTRFMMTLEDAVDLVFYAFEHANNGDIFVQKSPASTIENLANCICELLQKPDHPIKIVGTRHGEKLYESLLSKEERATAHDLTGYYRVPADSRDLNYASYFESGKQSATLANHGEEYNSHNTTRLGREEMKQLLLKLDFVKDIVEKTI